MATKAQSSTGTASEFQAKLKARAAEVRLQSSELITLPQTGVKIDVRAVTEGERNDAVKLSEHDTGAFSHAIIAAASYEPETDTLAFAGDSGRALIRDLPPADVAALFQAALRVLALDKPTVDGLGNA